MSFALNNAIFKSFSHQLFSGHDTNNISRPTTATLCFFTAADDNNNIFIAIVI